MSDASSSSFDYIAWWGAITGTLAILWEVFIWRRTRPHIRIDDVYLRKSDGGFLDKGNWIATISFTNIGEQTTKVTKVGYAYYKSCLHFLIRRASTGWGERSPLIELPPLTPTKEDVTIGGFPDSDPRDAGILFVWVQEASRRRPTKTLLRK